MRRQRTLCGIRIKSFGTLFVSAPLCGDSDLCDPDRNQSAVVGCFERTPLCEDCDLCDRKQITANIAPLRVLYDGIAATTHTHQRHAAKQKKRGGTWRGIITEIPRREVCSHTPITLATMSEEASARSTAASQVSGGVDVGRPVWMCGYCLPFSMKTMKETLKN